MAVQNTLIKKPDAGQTKVVEYTAGGETITLSLQDIKQYINPNVTDSEAFMFLNLCRYSHLNPFRREAYLIKYGDSPATMVVGKDTFVKRARNNADFDGFKAGIVVIDKNGNMVEREGSLRAPQDQMIGGWAKVFIKGMSTPYYAAVEWGEYAGCDRYGKLNGMWKSKGATMIRKVALSQALREAFPDDFGGLYEPEEINTIEEELPETPIQRDEIPAQIETAKEPEKKPEKKPARKPKEEKPKEEPEVVEGEVIEPDEDEAAVAAALFG